MKILHEKNLHYRTIFEKKTLKISFNEIYSTKIFSIIFYVFQKNLKDAYTLFSI